MHQHDVSRNPLNPVGCQPVVFGLSKFSNLLALVRAYSQVLKKHPGQRICKERFRDSAQHWLMLDPTSILAFLGGEIGGPASATNRIFLAKGLRCLENSGLLSFQHCQGDTIQKTETVKRIVLSQWALLDTCMCALCSALVIDMNWLAAWTAPLIAKTRKTLNQGTFLFFQHGKICSMLGSFSLGTRRSRDTAASATKESSSHQGLRCLENSSFFSFQHCQGDSLYWSDPLRKWKLWREWFSHDHC